MIMSGHDLNWEKMNKRLSHPLLINAIKTYITTRQNLLKTLNLIQIKSKKSLNGRLFE